MDFVTGIDEDGGEYKKWLCAEHFDRLQQLRKLLDSRIARDFTYRPPTPGKVIN